MELFKTFLVALAGSGLGMTIVNKIATYYIECALKKKTQDEDNRQQEQVERLMLENEVEEAQEDLLFWLYQAVIGQKNEDMLRQKYSEYEKATRKKKNNDQMMVVRYQTKKG